MLLPLPSLVLLGLLLPLCTGLIHDLRIHNDDRTLFKIETFGFLEVNISKLRQHIVICL